VTGTYGSLRGLYREEDSISGGTLYLMFALFSGLLGTAFSVLIRMELSGPGVQYIADNQLYNTIVTAHAILMIFFMVKIKINYIYNFNLLSSSAQSSVGEQDLQYCTGESKAEVKGYYRVCTSADLPSPTGSDNNSIQISNNNEEGNKDSKYKYVKVEVDNPFTNRGIILKVCKKQKGIYVWESLDGKLMYVGHSINLYNRISSYFMPSILKTKARRVLRHLNKHGFDDIKLTIYIMEENSSLDAVVSLEQHFIDSLKPNLNVDLVASSSGYHEPMSHEMREKLRKQRGVPVYIYNGEDFTLLYIFESKQHMYNSIKIHHTSLNDCIATGCLYLDTFFFSLDLIEESTTTNLLSLGQIQRLVAEKRDKYLVKHPAAKVILAEFKDDARKNLIFPSLNSLANHLKGDRQVIRDYLNGKKSGYYRGVWKFSHQNSN
jgi:hypothetical protein